MTERMRVGLLLAVSMLVYANTLPNSFAFDDRLYAFQNPAVTHFSVRGLFAPEKASNVLRPITFATFALNWTLGGERPYGYHLFNILLHAAVTLLLYLVLRKLLESFPEATTVAFVAALLFAVHPIHTEAVAWISARSELLAAGFLLAAWLLHLHDWNISALVCLVLAMMSKESAVAFLPLVLVGDYARGKLKPLLRYVWTGGTIALYLAVFWKLKGGRFGEKSVPFFDNPLASFPAKLRILNAFHIVWKYIGLQIYPATLSCDYSYNAILLYANLRHTLLWAVATLLLLGLWVWAVWTKRSAWVVAGGIYLGGFIATSNFLIMGERLASLPSAGFCLLVALIWIELEKGRRTLAGALLGILVVTLATRTVIRNRDWHDNFTLFSAAVRAVPGSFRAHLNLADEYMHFGRLEAARAEFQTAVAIYPDFPEAINNYGLVEFRLGHDQKARMLFERALSLNAKGTADYNYIELNLAGLLMKLGENDQALKILDLLIEEWPGFSPARSDRAIIRYQRGDVAGARSDAETALRVDPSNTQALNLLSKLNAPDAIVHPK